MFLTMSFITFSAPAANSRGENEDNRSTLQTLTREDGRRVPVLTSQAIRNALREALAARGLPSNRTRLHQEDQLAVQFKGLLDAGAYADDFLFGGLMTEKKAQEAVLKVGRSFRLQSPLQVNVGLGLSPHKDDTLLHQSPLNAGTSPWKNAGSSALLAAEVAITRFQVPLRLQLAWQTEAQREWMAVLVEVVGDLHDVAGNHARALFSSEPASLVARLGAPAAFGLPLYGFDEAGGFPHLGRLGPEDLPAQEFYLGGEIVRGLDPDERERLSGQRAHLFANPARLCAEIAQAIRAMPVPSGSRSDPTELTDAELDGLLGNPRAS